MKLKLFSALLCGMAMLVCLPSCRKTDQSEKIDLIPVKLTKNGNWSMMDKDGKIVFEDEFKNRPSVAYNGIFSVEEGDGYTLYKIGSKKPVAIKDCEKLKSVGYMEEGLIPVTFPNERISLINDNGKKQFTLGPVKNQEIVSCLPGYSDGMLGVKLENDKMGFVNKKGELVIPAKYKYVADFEDGLAVVCESADDESFDYKYSVINKKGEVVFKLKDNFEPLALRFIGDRLIVNNEDAFYLFDKKGEKTKLPSKIKRVMNMNDEYIIFRDRDDQIGVMDFKGEILIRPKYKDITFGEKDTFIAQREGEDSECLILDKSGETKKTLDYKEMMYVKGFGYFAQEGSTQTLLDEKFKSKCKEDIYDINLNITHNYNMVETDYFDVAGVAKTVVGMINSNGVGDYSLGASASSIMKDKEPRNFTYTSTIDLEDLNKSGFRYDITAKGMFTASMADYSYDYYSYSSNYYWNSASRLGGIDLNVSSRSVWGEAGFNAMKTALQNDGYKVVKSGVADDGRSYGALYKKGDILVYIIAPNKGYSCEIVIASSEVTPDLENSLKDSIDSNGKIQDVDNSEMATASSDFDFPSSAPVEAVAEDSVEVATGYEVVEEVAPAEAYAY